MKDRRLLCVPALGSLALLLLLFCSCSSQDNSGDGPDLLPEGQCTPGTAWCDGNWRITCMEDGTLSELPCPSESPCTDGLCMGSCEPGEGMCMGKIARMCNEEGAGFSLTDCGDGICVKGQCGTCYPGTRTCLDEETIAMCAEDGSGMEPLESCNTAQTKQACAMGQCISMCAVNLKEGTNVGCEYWAVDLDNFYDENEDGTVDDAQNSPFAVVVSNVHDKVAAVIQVTTFEGDSKTFEVPPGGLQVLPLDPRNVDGTVLAPLAYKIASDIPIIAYQFNPLSNVQVFSNDASMLIASGSLGKEYHVIAREQTGDNNRGFVAIVGTEDETSVTVTASCGIQAGEGVAAMIPGEIKSFTVAPYMVLNLETNELGDDLTGTVISANKPVAVFVGNECGLTPNTKHCIDGICAGGYFSCTEDWECPSVCCCDHLEEQLLPATGLGTHYIGVRSQRRGGEKDYWRILATEDLTQVTITPPVIEMQVLNQGEFVEFGAADSIEVHANHPVVVGQFLAGENAPKANYSPCVGATENSSGHCTHDPDLACDYHWDCPQYCFTDAECEAEGLGLDARIGDPSFILQVPVSLYRKEYAFLIPDKYAQDFVNIALPAGTRLWVDEKPVETKDFPLIGTGEYRIATSLMSDGVHTIRASRPIGLTVYGYDHYVSYGYPAGMTLSTLTGER